MLFWIQKLIEIEGEREREAGDTLRCTDARERKRERKIQGEGQREKESFKKSIF